jgi:hypothetical protein
MKTRFVPPLFALVVSCSAALAASPFAYQIVHYNPGTGYAPNFTQPQAALGDLSRINPFGEATDPFNPPYGTNQIVSIGAGGWIVVRFQTPLLNHPRNLRGLDFTVFGNTGFIITNEFDLSTFDWIGTPATDGSLFGQSTGEARVSVSRTGQRFYTLDAALTPALDSFPPSDGAGDSRIPLNPELNADDFAGATLEGIRTLYAGSAGGASMDISWARDAAGNSVHLPEVRYVRIDVLSGKLELDSIVAVARQTRPGPCRR